MSKILMNNKDYHASEAVGSTILKSIASKTVIHAIENPFVENEASILGSALHCKVLNPETFDEEFIVSPKFDRRTKAGKEGYAEFQEKAQGKSVLNIDQFELVEGMARAIFDHGTAKRVLTGGEAEFSYFTKFEGVDMELKCRPDYVNENVLIDVKSCRDASPAEFSRACANFNYHIQAAFYLDVYNKVMETKIKDFYFLVVENTSPHAVAIYKLDEESIELGRVQYRQALGKLSEYLKESKTGEIKKQKLMYGELIKELSLPSWAFNV